MAKKKYQLSERHQRALELCFQYAGIVGNPSRDAIKRLELCAARCASRISNCPALGIRMTSEILERAFLASDLYCALESKQDALDRIFRKGIGLSTGRKRHFKNIGQSAIIEAAFALEPIVYGSEIAQDLAFEVICNGKSRGDRAVRQLALSVAKEWQATTEQSLPVPVSRRFEGECWRADAGTHHPLWVLLDSIGINVGQGAVSYLCDFARGEALSAVPLHGGKFRL